MDMKRTPIAQSDCVREGVLNLSIGMSLPGSMEGRWEGLEPLRSNPHRSDPCHSESLGLEIVIGLLGEFIEQSCDLDGQMNDFRVVRERAVFEQQKGTYSNLSAGALFAITCA